MKRKWIAASILIAVVGTVIWVLSDQVSFSALADQERTVREFIAEHPVTSWVLGFFVYLLISLVPGTRGKAIAWGWLFGFWSGLVMVNVALTIAAMIGFYFSRYLFRDAVESRYALRLEHVNRALEANGAFYVLLLRVVPVSFSLTNYVLGATSVDRKTYWWATQLGLLPGNIVFINVGSQLPSLVELATKGPSAILSWQLIAAVSILSLFAVVAPIAVQRLAKRRALST
jgi:uncharacterized membrane protein YdjX (TVP38/TMEM64 family)